MTVVNTQQTPLQVFTEFFYNIIDEAARELDPDTLDALRQSVVMRFDRVADKAIFGD